MAICIGKREFVRLLGGAAAWPIAARGQQAAIPVIGFLSSGSLDSEAFRLTAFRQGLNETGYVEGRNVTIEFRGMQGHYDLLPAFVADFVRRPVAVIVAFGTTPGALAAKAATTKIPIVFLIGGDPVELGLVASLNRPGGNLTGMYVWGVELVPKRLELLHELVPTATVIAMLANPSNSQQIEAERRGATDAARALGLQLHILPVTTENEIEAAFATLGHLRVGALLISSEAFFQERSEQLGALTIRHAVPAIHAYREFTAAGGLINYGSGDRTESFRQVGVYVGRILKGEKPADLPAQRSTKVELIINLKTAKALGLTVPLTLLGRADEVIE